MQLNKALYGVTIHMNEDWSNRKEQKVAEESFKVMHFEWD